MPQQSQNRRIPSLEFVLSAKSGSRFFIRFILFVLLVLAVANAVYVFYYTPSVPPVSKAAPDASRPGVPVEFSDHADDWKYFSRPTWRGEIAYRKEENGSYSFRVTTVDLRGPITLTSKEAFVKKASGGDEAAMPLKETEKGELVANYRFSEPGEWIIRVRLGRRLETLEFSERIEIK